MPATLVTGAVGAVIGGLAGGLISVASQLWFSKPKKTLATLDWRAIGGAALQGAVTGGLAGLTLGATALIPSLATRVALASGGSIISGLLGLLAGAGVTGVAPTKSQIMATVVGSAIGGAFGGALAGPSAATMLSSVPRVVAAGAVTGAFTGATSQTAEEATNGFRPGAGKRILAATGAGGAIGASAGAVAGVIANALPSAPRTGSTPAVDPGDSTAIGVVGAIDQMSVEETTPHPTSANLEGTGSTPPESTAAPARGSSLDRELGEETPPKGQTHEDWKKNIPAFALEDPVADTAYFAREVPGFRSQLETLEKQGWKIQYGEPGAGSTCNSESNPPTITIDPSLDPNEIFKTLAHEVGHAFESPTPVRDPASLTRDQYVAQRLQDMTLSEGQAVLNEMRVLEAFRKAILGRTGQSPKLAYRGQYVNINDNTRLTDAQKILQMGQRYMTYETPSTTSGETYNQHWTRLFGEAWDEAHH